ncbi:putative transcriptional regulator [Candidatus Zixiibacteriota bacterium]|nr:putative transcriptional regulator [candidate division Zixibacteria bacterium]
MKKKLFERLSRRERQIIEIIYRIGEATVAQVQEGLSDPPSYSSVRALLGILVKKGFVKFEKRGKTYVYLPTVSREKARHSALSNIVQTYFDGSVEGVVTTLIDISATELTDRELEKLEEIIRERRRKEGAHE